MGPEAFPTLQGKLLKVAVVYVRTDLGMPIINTYDINNFFNIKQLQLSNSWTKEQL